MKYCLITFRSVTPAQRGERALKQAGIHASMARTPKWMEQQGCGYSLRLWIGDIHKPIKALQEAQEPFRKVYIQGTDGGLEEWNG